MLKTLIEKEWKSVLLSPKFALTFTVSAVLILLSIGVGIQEYRAFEAQQDASQKLLEQDLREQTSWGGLSMRAFRDADPLQIFVSGVHNDVGRLAYIDSIRSAKLDQSIYSDESILAVFRSLDLSFIVVVVLSLFAILFTYDAINGERESGTLRLVFSGAVPRARFVLAKFTGTWLGLALPLALPVLLGLLAVVLVGVPMNAEHWKRLLLFLLASALYFTFFVAFGIAVSALTRRPQTSFLILLVSWVLMVLVIPRAGLLAAVHMVPVPTASEMESRKSGYEARAWEDYRRGLQDRWQERQAQSEGLDDDEVEALEWQWMEEDDKSRKELQAVLAAYAARLNEDLRNKKAEQERLAFALSRVSPASSYRLASMSLAGTGVDVKARYEDAARRYKSEFIDYVQKNDGGKGGHQIVIGRRKSGSNPLGGDNEPLDLTEMPRFQTAGLTFAETAARTPGDLGLLVVESLLCFVFGFVGFLRYDVR